MGTKIHDIDPDDSLKAAAATTLRTIQELRAAMSFQSDMLRDTVMKSHPSNTDGSSRESSRFQQMGSNSGAMPEMIWRGLYDTEPIRQPPQMKVCHDCND
eukprot:GHVU01065362.1.p4 GENE.GHVU01065362.1~~GHVU01065362.1.p4  ORF type:complete len:100 (-),score=10.72 GHVU01065362.1:500-799(-)